MSSPDSISFAVWLDRMAGWEVISENPRQTRTLGRLLGEAAEPGLVVLLAGELGTGKTCFAQGVAAGLGIAADSPVTSPSYTLLNVHYGRFPLYHFDLYRLARVDDLADLGYDEIAEGDGLTLVEWADRMSTLPDASLSVVIERVSEETRRLAFFARDERGQVLLHKISTGMVSS